MDGLHKNAIVFFIVEPSLFVIFFALLIDADRFTHTLFNEVELTTDMISTYQMEDGNTYTAFWSMWSGTGKFTGQKMTLPFYCISLWEGNQVSKIWRYMEPSGLNKEITAFEGINKNSK